MWLTDGFLLTIFGRWRGTVCTHVNSCVAYMWLPYMVINMQDGWGDSELRKTQKVWKTSNFYKGGGSISGHIGSHE